MKNKILYSLCFSLLISNTILSQQKSYYVNPVTKKASVTTTYNYTPPKKHENNKKQNAISAISPQSAGPLSLSTSFTNETCGYKADGTASVTPSGGVPPYTYYWDGSTATGKTTASITGLYSGEYTVIVTDSACTYDTAIVNVGINNAVYLGFSSSGSSEFCGRCNGELSVTGFGGAGNKYYYSWSPGGQTTDTLKNLCAGYYVFTITDSASGCSQTFDSAFYGPGLPYYPGTVESIQPKLGIDYFQSCDDTISFFAEYFFPIFMGYDDTSCYKPLSWQWNFGDGATSSIEDPIHTYSVVGTYTVTLVVNTSDTATVVINYNPNSTKDFGANTNCNSFSIDFYDASTICVNSWLWNFGDPASGSLNSDTNSYASHTYPSPGTYTISLVINSTDTIVKAVTIDSVHANFEFYTDCSTPATISFSDISTCGASSWHWNFGDPTSGTADTSTTQNPTHIYASSGTYIVTLIVTGNGLSDTIQQQVLIPAALNVNLGNDTVITQGSSITLDVGMGVISNYWSSGQSTKQITVNQTGIYYVTVQDSAYCLSVSSKKIVVVCGANTSGIIENNTQLKASIYPNPAEDIVSLVIENRTSQGLIILTDVIGKEVMRSAITNDNSTFNLGSLNPGMYFYKIIANDNKSTEGKLIIK